MTEQAPQENVQEGKLVEITPKLKINLTKVSFIELAHNEHLEIIIEGKHLIFKASDYNTQELFNLINSMVVKNG